MRPRPRIASWGWVGILVLLPAIATAQDRPFRPRLVLPPGPVFVGQIVEGRIVYVGGPELPRVDWPEDPVEIRRSGSVTLVTVDSSAIGGRASEVFEVRVPVSAVPKRAGTLTVPSIRVRSGSLDGSTAPRRIEARLPPASGRTGRFLGGIGRVEAVATVDRRRLRVGEEVEYTIELRGPGALGSARPPDLADLARLPIGARILVRADSSAVDPPSRTFRFGVRPSKPGKAAIPPVRIDWFDPSSGRYQTTASNAVPIEVVDVPSVEAGDLIGPLVRSTGPGWGVAVGLGAAILGLGAAIVEGMRRGRRRRAVPDPAGLLRIARDEIRDEPDPEAMARRIVDRLAEALHAGGGRGPGVLTASEAAETILHLLGDARLAGSAGGLVAGCDRVLYGRERAEIEGLRAVALEVFGDLADSLGRRKPGEASGGA